MVGVRDVAKSAGVSVGTVSSVLNNSVWVSDEIRSKVERAMKELGYVPNELARNLFRNRTDLVGVIVPTIAHPFFAELVEHLENHLSQHGLRVMLCSTNTQQRGEQEYVEMLRRHMMDCIIMCAHTIHPSSYWESIGRPIVAVDRNLGGAIPNIGSDHVQGGRFVANALIKSGATHVVQVGASADQLHDLEDLQSGMSRIASFPSLAHHVELIRLLTEHGIAVETTVFTDMSHSGDLDTAADAIFEQFPDVDAIVAPDTEAAVCLRRALAAGMRVPQDLQIIAYDGSSILLAAGMDITAVVQDFDQIAKRTVDRVLKEIESEHAPEQNDVNNPDVGTELVPVSFMQGLTTR
ncbi:MAG: LacI family DNA-binding transcriptional regulator [Bifidobacterium sp.]|jgi:LacI family sucrose operon transcriptional repressor|nr:LacI family DNA-binding transcriptional regulator [Bifidobacterium sp.]MCH4174564.1 LacI family DNA-binding transcriptional regulator [Bifidobacterium sp.]